MISNERRWPHQEMRHDSHYERRGNPPERQRAPEDSLASRELQIERKHFRVMLKENERGRFVRIAEDTGGRSNSIIVPASGLKEFQALLAEMVKAAGEESIENKASSL